MSHLVELCAGTASVSLYAMGRAGPLTGYMGSKRRYAAQIVDLLGIGRPDLVTLVDAGPWGDVWSVLRSNEHRHGVAAVLDSWAATDPALLWVQLVSQAPPDDPALRVAQFLWLQSRTAGCIPIWWSPAHQKWRAPTGAVDPDASRDADRLTKGLPERVGRPASKGIAPSIAGRRGWGSGRRTASLIATRVRWLHALPWDRIEVIHGDLRYVEPFAATVYIDPPYVRGARYAATLSRTQLVEVAARWEAAGARVAISEREPVRPGLGWSSRRLDAVEWLSSSWPLTSTQLGLLAGAR